MHRVSLPPQVPSILLLTDALLVFVQGSSPDAFRAKAQVVFRDFRANLMLGSRGWVLSGLETEVGSQGVMGEQGPKVLSGETEDRKLVRFLGAVTKVRAFPGAGS